MKIQFLRKFLLNARMTEVGNTMDVDKETAQTLIHKKLAKAVKQRKSKEDKEIENRKTK